MRGGLIRPAPRGGGRGTRGGGAPFEKAGRTPLRAGEGAGGAAAAGAEALGLVPSRPPATRAPAGVLFFFLDVCIPANARIAVAFAVGGGATALGWAAVSGTSGAFAASRSACAA